MDSRRTHRNLLPYRITLWFVVLTCIATGLLIASPLSVKVELPSEGPVELERHSRSEVIVVLDYARIVSSGSTFSERDFSAAWINVFEQELGPFSIATPGSLSESMLKSARVIVLTSSASDSVPEILFERLRERMLEDGLVVLAERPGGLIRKRYGADAEVGMQRPSGVTFARGLREPFNRELLAMPVSTEYLGSTAPRAGAETLFSLDGAPVIYSIGVGKGTMIIADLDIGEQLLSLQQGRPDEDFMVDTEGSARTSDLVADAKMLESDVPYADLFERFLVHGVLGRYQALPAFWPYPAGADGVVVATHADVNLGDGATWMQRYEARRKATSTLFTPPATEMRAAEAAVVQRLGSEIGLLWHLQGSPHQIMDSFGLFDLEPFARPRSLEDQLDELGEVSATRPRAARTSGHYWTQGWAAAFSALSSQRVYIDSSYTPESSSGYAFGTGFPFLALDSTGLPLSIREYPVVVPDRAASGPSLVELLDASSDGHHQAIGVDVAPAAFADHPDIEQFEEWAAIFDQADTYRHPIVSAASFDGFLRDRRASSLGAELSHDVALESEDSEARVTLLRVTAEAARSGLELMLPERVGGKSLFRVQKRDTRSSEDHARRELETRDSIYSGFEVRRIPLDVGFNTLDIFYR